MKAKLAVLRAASVLAQLFFAFAYLKIGGFAVAGIIGVQLAAWTVSRVVGTFGVDQLVLREVSAFRRGEQELNEKLYLARALMFTSKASLLTSILASIFIYVIGAVSISGIASWITVCFLLPLASVMVNFLRNSKYLVKAQTIDALLFSTLPSCAAGTLAMSSNPNTVETIFHWCFLVFTVAGIMWLAWLCRLVVAHNSELLGHSQIALISVKSTWPLASTQMLVALNSRLPLLIAGVFFSKSSVGIYDLASKFQLIGATLAWLGGTLNSTKYSPKISNREENARLIRAEIIGIGIVVISLAALILPLFWWASGYFGLWNNSLFCSLIVVAIGTLLEVPLNVLGYYLQMTGKERKLLILSGVQFFSILILVPLFASLQIEEGIAYSFAIAALVRLALLFIFIQSKQIANPFSRASKGNV